MKLVRAASDPLYESDWSCESCKRSSSIVSVVEADYTLQARAPAYDTKNPAAIEKFLEANLYPRGDLHPTHTLVLILKQTLIRVCYGHAPGYTYEGRVYCADGS